jgi:class 3 adenylate cyclase
MADRPTVSAVADAIPGASFVEVEGSDVYPIAGDVDAVVVEISRFVTGSASLPSPDRSVRAVLFTDLVASTGQAVDAGDEAWRGLLDRHDATVRSCVERAGGSVVKFTGDGVLALLPSAAAGIAVARSIRAELETLGLGVRSGVHVGDVDHRGDDVSGLAVNVAARVMDQAQPGETLVSESVVLSTLGSDITFEEPHTASLKGLPGDWRLYRIRGAD